MTRILLVETASPKRICQKAEQILSAGFYSDPDITILCTENSGSKFLGLSRTKVYAIGAHGRHHALKELNQKKFDVILAFWTGEKQYRFMKLCVLRLKAKAVYIDSGDGNEFRLTWKAIIRHTLFRWKHPLPTDHYNFIQPAAAIETGHRNVVQPSADHEASPRSVDQPPADFDGDKIIIIQSAQPSYVLKALDRLEERPLFRNPRYMIFCRNWPDVIRSFQGHPMIYRILTHSETRGFWKHFRNLRRERFDVVVLFLTGDPGFWKIKVFAFLLGARHKLIFNESIDCFYFTFNQWFALISHRMAERPHPGVRFKRSRSTRILLSLMLKTAILPFRFAWLLIVWLWLRFAGWRFSR